MGDFEHEHDSTPWDADENDEWINITPAPFLPYAPAWTAWLEHAAGCPLCTRATIKHIRQEEVFDDELCPAGVPLGLEVATAVHEQHHRALLN